MSVSELGDKIQPCRRVIRQFGTAWVQGPRCYRKRSKAMLRSELRELHCIMPIANMPSVMQHGILSHLRADRLAHDSTADPEVQVRRARVRVPGGRPLHEYANLYVTARNAMMYVRREQHERLCVLSVDTAVLDIPGTVITDKNASADYVRFLPAPDGLAMVDKALIDAISWNDPDYFEKVRKMQAKQAEVLVPDQVPPNYIKGAYLSTSVAEAALQAMNTGCRTKLRPTLFFR